jgi:hypothetical protein
LIFLDPTIGRSERLTSKSRERDNALRNALRRAHGLQTAWQKVDIDPEFDWPSSHPDRANSATVGALWRELTSSRASGRA